MRIYKIVIPGVATVKVSAYTIQEAILKAAGNLTGNIMVNDETMYIKNGIISEKLSNKVDDQAWVKASDMVKSIIIKLTEEDAEDITDVVQMITDKTRSQSSFQKSVSIDLSRKMRMNN